MDSEDERLVPILTREKWESWFSHMKIFLNGEGLWAVTESALSTMTQGQVTIIHEQVIAPGGTAMVDQFIKDISRMESRFDSKAQYQLIVASIPKTRSLQLTLPRHPEYAFT